MDLPSHSLVVQRGTGRWVPLHLLLPRGSSEAADLVSGIARNASTSVVVDATTGDVRWRARSWTLGKFSTSGRYVAGEQVVGVQPEPDVGDVVGIFDAETGHQVLRRELPGLVLAGLPVWEGDGAVLVVARDKEGRETIVRIGLNGSVSRATRIVQDTSPPTTGRPSVTVLRFASTP